MATELDAGGGSGEALDQSHTVVVTPPLKTFHSAPLSADTRVYYDECNDELVVLQGSNFQISPLFHRSSKTLNRLNTENYCHAVGRAIRGVKRSLGKSWLAVLKSDKMISFYDLGPAKSRPFKYYYECKQNFQLGKAIVAQRRTNVVKDMFWLSDTAIFIVTTTALEIFRLHAPREQLQRVKHLATTVDYYSYNSRLKVFLCVNRSKPNWVKTFRVGQTTGIHKYNKLRIEDAVSQEHNPEACMQWYSFTGEKMPLYHMQIARVYGQTCLLHITTRQELVVYTLRVSSNSWDRTAVLNLYERSSFALSVVDNLILVHNLSNRITMIYDHRLGRSEYVSPVTAPMAMSVGPLPEGYRRMTVGTPTHDSTPSATSSAVRLRPPTVESLYNPAEVQYVHPDKVLDFNGGLYTIALNLPAIAAAFTDKRALLEFLMQRRKGRKEVMACIRSILLSNHPLSQLGGMFDVINAALARGLREHMAIGSDSRSSYYSIPRHSSMAAPSTSSASVGQPSPSPTPPSNPQPNPPQASSPSSTRDTIGSPTTTRGGESPMISPRTTPPESPKEASDDPPVTTVNGLIDAFDPSMVPAEMHTHPIEYPFIVVGSEWYTRDMVLVVEQVDIWRDVFTPVHEDRRLEPQYFNAAFMEYVRSLSVNQIRLKDELQRFLVDILIYSTPPNYPKLHQYLQYHVIEDTLPIALQLLKLEELYPPSFQLSLDMLCRLKAFPEIVEILITRGHLVRAVEIMNHNNVKNIDPSFILSRAADEDDPLVLSALVDLMKKYNVGVRGIQGMPPTERCPKFEEKYLKVLGVPVVWK
eukprot:Sspe_Gene.43751::Locus_21370_Transcript_1_1_Confidence_1.000_Length_2508::g.43751::m.43751